MPESDDYGDLFGPARPALPAKPTPKTPAPPIAPPPRDSIWSRIHNFFRHHLSNIVSHPVCSFSFACALACMLGVWFSNGDFFVMIPVLLLGWIFAALGWCWAPNLSTKAKALWIVFSALPLIVEGLALRLHLVPQNGVSLEAGATIKFDPLPPRQLNDSFVFPIQIQSRGEQPALNYSFHFRQSLTSGILTAVEENQQFDDSSRNFYAEVEIVKKLKVPGIANILSTPEILILTQPNTRYGQDIVEKINKGQLFIYYFLVFRFTDKNSREANQYFDSEFCARLQPYGGYIPCTFHNFLKKPE